MRRLIFIISFAALTMVLGSWTTLLVKRFEHFVDKVEKNAESYTEKDWEEANQTFSDLMKEYDEDYEKCTDEQHERIDKCIGRYHALVVKSGADDAIQALNEVLGKLSVKIRSILTGIESFFQGLKNQ